MGNWGSGSDRDGSRWGSSSRAWRCPQCISPQFVWDLKLVVLNRCLSEKRSSLDLCLIFAWGEFFITLALRVSGQLPHLPWDASPCVVDTLVTLWLSFELIFTRAWMWDLSSAEYCVVIMCFTNYSWLALPGGSPSQQQHVVSSSYCGSWAMGYTTPASLVVPGHSNLELHMWLRYL